MNKYSICKKEDAIIAIYCSGALEVGEIKSGITKNPSNSPITSILKDYEKKEFTLWFYKYLDGDKTRHCLTLPFDSYLIIKDRIPLKWDKDLNNYYTIKEED